MNRSAGFAPIAGDDAVVLILGTLPSVRSLEKGEYYGHPQNAFWKIMGDLFDAGPELGYAERVERLRACKVAVWDVLSSSVRPGSMDAAIDSSTATPNDFAAFFASHPGIRQVFFNGRKSAELFERFVAANGVSTDLNCVTLPSTSPAFAAMSYGDKLSAWSQVRNVVQAC